MIGFALTLVIAGLIIVVSEYLWRKKIISGEYARKSMHIVLGVYYAALPLYLPWRSVQILGVLALGLFLLVHFTKVLKSLHDIKRRSWGDIIAPVVFTLLALVEPSRVLFAAVVLHVALADGFASVLGVKYGRNNQYKAFGYTKSIVGSLTFFLVSVCIMVGIVTFGGVNPSIPIGALLLVPLLTTIIENFASYGIDNALIAGTVIALFYIFKIK